MKAYEGFKSEQATVKFEQLPAGCYVAGIKGVRVEGQEPDQRLALQLDVIEGEYAGYYTKRYEHESKNSNGKFEVKYKGILRVNIPNDANTNARFPDSDKKTFNNMIWCIETSNPGYHWDWNEQGLKGKTVGINVRNASFNDVAYTTIGKLENADNVRQGLAKPMNPAKPRYSDGYSSPNNPAEQVAGFTTVEDVELPF